MSRRSIAVLPVLVLSLLVSSCAKREDRVVARVEDKVITVADMERTFRALPDWSPEQVDSARTAALNRLIDDKLIAVEGDRMGFREDEQITKGLEDRRRRAIVSELYQKVVVERAKVKEGEVKRYYDMLAEEVKTRHILLETAEQADSVYAELTKEGGKSFEDLAKECSTDKRTQAQGGDLGWLKWGRMVEEFQKVAFSLQAGETSRPVKTGMGYHIIRVDDRREVERRPWEEEKERITRQLERDEMRRLSAQYWENLKKKGQIEIDEEVLNMLAEKTPKQERRSFGPPPLPAVTGEDKEKVLVTSVLGEWTVNKVFEEAEKFPRRPGFDQAEAKGFVEWLVTNELLFNEAKRMHLDRSRKVNLEIENEIDRLVASKFTREQINAKAEVWPDELMEYYNAHIEDYTQGETVQPFDQAKRRVENEVLRQKREKLKEEILSRLREEIEVEINHRNLGLVGASS